MLESGTKQADIVKRSGLNQSYFANYMAGRSKTITIANLEKIAKAIGVKLSYLIQVAEKQKE